jgi:hypothetical protein
VVRTPAAAAGRRREAATGKRQPATGNREGETGVTRQNGAEK